MPTTIATIQARIQGGQQVEKGLNKIGQQTERVGRAQTRLGQASASAGRQFSSQAQGLGGLVQAYAGAAANVFAITAAFTALSRAAEFEQIIKGTEALASSIGANGQRIIESVQGITRSQLSLLETAQTVNIGLAAGFSTQQIEELSDVSLRASKALGRSLTDAFTRVSRGAAKLEPELLDELGIFTRIDPAVRAYADSVGRSVSSLTNFERRQAFANAVIEEGQRKFRDVDTTSDSAAVSLEKLSATIIDLGLKFGAVLANAVAPLADFITGNLSNSLALFGILANQIGGLAVTVLSAGIDKATASLTNLGNSAVLSLNSLSSAFNKATKASAENAKSKVTLTRFGTQEEQMRKSLARATLQEIAAGKALTGEKLKEAKARLQTARTIEIEFARRSTSTNNKIAAVNAARSLNKQILLLDAAQKKAVVGTTLLSLGIRGLTASIGFLGSVLSRALGFIFTFITVASLAQLALDGLGKAFGFQVNILESIIGALKNVIDSFTETSRVVDTFSAGFKEDLEAAARSAGLFGEEVSTALKEANDLFAQVIKFATDGSAVIGTGIFDSRIVRTPEQLAAQIERLRKESPGAVAVLEKLIFEMKNLGDGSLQTGYRIAQLIEQIAKLSGVSKKDVTNIVRGFSDLNDTLEFSVKNGQLFINSFQISTLEDGVFRLKQGFDEVSSVVTQGIDKINDFNRGLKDGSLDAERAAQAAGAIANVISQAEAEQLTLNARIQATTKLLESAEGSEKERLENQLKELNLAEQVFQEVQKILEVEFARADAQAGVLAGLEKESKLRKKIFGNAGEKLEESRLRGLVSGTGEVAQTSDQRELNTLNALTSDLEAARSLLKSFDQENEALLNKEKNIKTSLKDVEAELALLTKQGLMNSEAANQASQKKADLSNQLVQTQDEIANKTSQEAQAKADVSQITDILAQKDLERLGTLEKELNTIQRIANSRDQTLEATQIKFAKERLKFEQEIADQVKQQELNRLNQVKAVRELLGIFTDIRSAEFIRDKFQIELSQAEADKRRQDKLAEIQFREAEQRRIAAALAVELQNKELTDRFNFLNDQAAVLDASNANLDDILKARITELARAMGNTSFNAKPRSERRGEVGELAGGFSDAYDEAFKDLIKTGKENNTILEELNKQNLKDTKDINQTRLDIFREAGLSSVRLAEIEASTRFKVFKSFADGTNETLAPALEGVFDSIAEGTFTVKNLNGELNNFFKSLVDNIRKKLLKETLIDPLSSGIKDSIAGGFFNTKTGEAKEGGIGSFLSGLFGGKASGGLVHMAGGGQVRDRVPAMLEPGEFVIRKPMAKAIGGPVLNAMNATGSMPTGEVAVNITNTGTPQEATASPPRFDGEKMVVDIVMRDLRNNGPIRKSLRAGG